MLSFCLITLLRPSSDYRFLRPPVLLSSGSFSSSLDSTRWRRSCSKSARSSGRRIECGKKVGLFVTASSLLTARRSKAHSHCVHSSEWRGLSYLSVCELRSWSPRSLNQKIMTLLDTTSSENSRREPGGTMWTWVYLTGILPLSTFFSA